MRAKFDTAEGELNQLSTVEHQGFKIFLFIPLLIKQLFSRLRNTKSYFLGARENTKFHNQKCDEKPYSIGKTRFN